MSPDGTEPAGTDAPPPAESGTEAPPSSEPVPTIPKIWKRFVKAIVDGIYSGVAGVIIGAGVSLAVLAITRPDVETAKIGDQIDALTLSGAQKLTPSAGYKNLKRTYA